MPDGYFVRDGIRFRYREIGDGPVTFVFQHGLGSDLDLTLGLLPPLPGFRVLGFDARAHGGTYPTGDPALLSIPQTVDDLGYFLDRMKVERAVVGGISMGAAVALRFGMLHPDRTLGLILSRPAWLDQPNPPNLALFPLMASLIREHGAEAARERFATRPEFLEFTKDAPDAAAVLLGQFQHPRIAETFEKFAAIPPSRPWHDRAEWARIKVPTLILSNDLDPIHPIEMAHALRDLIPGSEIAELTSKSISIPRHEADAAREIASFLARHDWTGR